MKNKFNCKHCGKEIMAKSLGIEKSSSGLVIKNVKLVFFTNNGEVLIKCKGCKSVTPVPLKYNHFYKSVKLGV